MKLHYITIMVRDLDRSVAFYQELAGLSVVRRFRPGEKGEIAFLANGEGETMLELACFDGAPTVETKELVFSFLAGGALAQLRDKALRLGYEPSEILSHPPKPDFFTVCDPDGTVVEFSA